MSEGVASTSPPVCPAATDEATGGTSTDEQDGASNSREVRCSGCIVWNRQQTWLCAVPLLIGFIGLGLSLMLLKWIVVGSVKDYVPTDLVDAKGIGQDPIFLSKPSSYPKNPESTTTVTSRTPNRISTRITTTTHSPKSISTAKETTFMSSRAPTSHRVTSPPTHFTTTGLVTHLLPGTPTPHSMPLWPTATYATSSNKVYLHDSTPSWTMPHFQESTIIQDITSTTPKFSTTTYSTEHSEHFKPCKDKDLAYCLNDGECFVIETLTGSHKHCRCKEGYQGVRCDQFLPKTDSILSDPTDHLGIEFMESEDVYQRQLLSASCITFGLITVGMFCAIFYIKTKKQHLKIQEQLKDTPGVKNYIMHTSNIANKSENLPHSSLQLQKYTKTERHSEPSVPEVMESCFSHSASFPETPSADRGILCSKHQRSPTSCCSPGQKSGMLQRNAFRRTPPLSHGRLNGLGGPAYRQLQEAGLMEQDYVHYQGCPSSGVKSTQATVINMQPTSREKKLCLNSRPQKDKAACAASRAISVPIIPSVVLGDSCMQMQNISEVSDFKNCNNSHSVDLVNVNTPGSPCLMIEHQDVEILLETVQEQIRILTNARSRSEDYELAITEPADVISENTAFLPLTPLAKSEREMQFVFKNESQRNSALTK